LPDGDGPHKLSLELVVMVNFSYLFRGDKRVSAFGGEADIKFGQLEVCF